MSYLPEDFCDEQEGPIGYPEIRSNQAWNQVIGKVKAVNQRLKLLTKTNIKLYSFILICIKKYFANKSLVML
jgi:hypothetical protein